MTNKTAIHCKLYLLFILVAFTDISFAQISTPCNYCGYCPYCDNCNLCPCDTQIYPKCNFCKYCIYCKLCSFCTACLGNIFDYFGDTFLQELDSTMGPEYTLRELDEKAIKKELKMHRIKPIEIFIRDELKTAPKRKKEL